MPSYTAGGRLIDNKLHFGFMRMGWGDSTIIKCPTGEIYIVDIGSGRYDKETADDDDDEVIEITPEAHFQSDNVLGIDKNVSALILTHSDRDHYNKVGILSNVNVKIDKVYHSNFLKLYYGGSKPAGGGSSNKLIEIMCLDNNNDTDWGNMRRVTYNENDKKYTTWNENTLKYVTVDIEAADDDDTDDENIDKYTDGRGIMIHSAGGCKIYLLCSEVTSDDENAQKRQRARQKQNKQNIYEKQIAGKVAVNRASIITLVEYDNKQYVICGDAVGETESFILSKYNDIEDVEILRCAHHGSDTEGSNSQEFAVQMNPNRLVVSAYDDINSDHLPNCKVIDLFISKAPRLKDTTNISTYGCNYEKLTPRLTGGKRKKTVYDSEWFFHRTTAEARISATGWDGDHRWIHSA